MIEQVPYNAKKYKIYIYNDPQGCFSSYLMSSKWLSTFCQSESQSKGGEGIRLPCLSVYAPGCYRDGTCYPLNDVYKLGCLERTCQVSQGRFEYVISREGNGLPNQTVTNKQANTAMPCVYYATCQFSRLLKNEEEDEEEEDFIIYLLKV